jgi:hypothetical protein
MAPRLSIIPGRFVEDDRADLNHYRVLTALGRHTDADGWCRVKQAGLGEAVGLSRECVCRKMRDLTAWGYVEKHEEDGSGRAIFYRVLLDAKVTPSDTGAAAKKKACRPPAKLPLETPSEPAAGPVTLASQVVTTEARTCDAGITPGVTPADHTRCDTWRHNSNDPSQRPFSTTLSPLPPLTPAAPDAGGGVRSIDWLDDLRAEGQPAAILDDLLGKLAAAGLTTWKDCPDPRGPARQVCLDLAGDPPDVIAAVCDLILDRYRYRLPPVAVFRDIAGEARAAHAHAQHRAALLARLEAVPVLAAETERLLGALRDLATPQFVAAWFAPCGVASVARNRRVVTIATPHHPVHVAQFAGSIANAAVRALWGAQFEVEFVRGRPVPATRRIAS